MSLKLSKLARFTGVDSDQVPLINKAKAYLALLKVCGDLKAGGCVEGELVLTCDGMFANEAGCYQPGATMDEEEIEELFGRIVNLQEMGPILMAHGQENAHAYGHPALASTELFMKLEDDGFSRQFLEPLKAELIAAGVDVEA
jgi:hypothetical protein